MNVSLNYEMQAQKCQLCVNSIPLKRTRLLMKASSLHSTLTRFQTFSLSCETFFLTMHTIRNSRHEGCIVNVACITALTDED